MNTLDTVSLHDAAPAGKTPDELIDRSVGAIVTALFGALWIGSGAWVLAGPKIPLLLAVGTLAASLVAAASRFAPRPTKHHKGEPLQAERVRRNKAFHVINGLQWASILFLIVGLNVLQRPQWITAGIVMIVGLHFLPLARLFRSTSHGVAGVALVSWALVYPLVAAGGPMSPWGAVGAGLILWAFSAHLVAVLAQARGGDVAGLTR